MRRPALQAGRKGPGYETCLTESPAMLDLTQCVVGVDLGDRKSLACVYAQGVVIGWFEFEMTREAVQAAFKGKGYLPGPTPKRLSPAGGGRPAEMYLHVLQTRPTLHSPDPARFQTIIP